MTLCCRGFHPMNLPFIVLFSIKMMLFSETAGLCQKILKQIQVTQLFLFLEMKSKSLCTKNLDTL